MEFDRKFEESILSQALKDANYLKRAARILDEHHFSSPQHAWIWKVLRDIWNKYREQATSRLIVVRAQADFSDDEDRLPYIRLVKKLQKKKSAAATATLDELSKFVRSVNAQLALESAAVDLEKGNVDKVYETVRQLARKELKPRIYTHEPWIENFEERQRERKHRKEHPEDYLRIPTGWSKLDAIIGGIELGELGLMLATTGKGKSISLNNLGYACVKRLYPAVYFALEMPARQIAMRQDARWLGINYDKFKNYDFSPSELRSINKRLIKVRKRWNGLLHIVSMPLGLCDINAIRDVLDDLYQEQGFRPKMVLVDSGDHMNGVGRFESYRLEQKAVYVDLKTLAEEEGYAVWSSCHAGKEWATATATAEATGESYDKARIADIVCSINTPEKRSRSTKTEFDDDGEEMASEAATLAATASNYVELYLAKYRDGKSRITVPMDAVFDKMLMQELAAAEAE